MFKFIIFLLISTFSVITAAEEIGESVSELSAVQQEAADMVHHAGILTKLGNFKGSEEWYLKASKLGSAEADYYLGVMEIRGYVRDKNVDKAIEYYTKSAEAGFVKAQYELSVIYQDKDLNRVNHQKYLYWLKKAASQNHTISIYNLATIAVRVEKYPTAFKLFNKASKLGYAPADNALGQMYFHGTGVPTNYNFAAQKFEQALNKGEFASVYLLATLYEQGKGIKKDVDRAKELYGMAIEKGFVKAKFNLAMLLISDEQVKEGLTIMADSAASGDARAVRYMKNKRTTVVKNKAKQ